MKQKPRLIGICGAAGSGKDTLARGIAQVDVYFVYSLADPIKLGLNAMFGWTMHQWENREWKEKSIDWLGVSPRVLAQTLGTEWGREQVKPEIWLNCAQQKYWKIEGTAQVVGGGRIAQMGMIIPDIRFENEAQWIKDEGGLMLELHRPDHEPPNTGHSSEGDIPVHLLDAAIVNVGPPSKMITEARRILWAS